MAMIQVLSSCVDCVDGGGLKATFLPGWRIEGLKDGSFLFLESLEVPVGPTEFVRGGTVIDTERAFPEARDIGVPGEDPLGLLFLLSPAYNCFFIQHFIIYIYYLTVTPLEPYAKL